MRPADPDRAVSPVVGMVLMIVITLLLAGTIGGLVIGLEMERGTAEGILEEEAPAESATSSPTLSGSALVLTKDPGEEPRTHAEDVLEFTVKNSRSDSVTVVGFAVDATGIDTGVEIDDSNAEEVEIRRSDEQKGFANRDDSGGIGAFAANGTEYEFVADSTNGGQNATIAGSVDDARVDVRSFSRELGSLVIAESLSDADLTVRLRLADGSTHAFHFRQSS